MADPRLTYEDGYSNGENNHAADWDFAMTEALGLSEDCDISPMRVADALAAILSDGQKRQLEALLLPPD